MHSFLCSEISQLSSSDLTGLLVVRRRKKTIRNTLSDDCHQSRRQEYNKILFNNQVGKMVFKNAFLCVSDDDSESIDNLFTKPPHLSFSTLIAILGLRFKPFSGFIVYYASTTWLVVFILFKGNLCWICFYHFSIKRSFIWNCIVHGSDHQLLKVMTFCKVKKEKAFSIINLYIFIGNILSYNKKL